MTAQGARARHDTHGLSQRLRPAGRRAGHHRARPGHCSAAPSRNASRATTAISRPAPSPSAADASATTTACSAGSKASTASRPATPARPASTLSPRCAAATATSSASCSAAAAAARATPRMRNLIAEKIDEASPRRTVAEIAEPSAPTPPRSRPRPTRRRGRPRRVQVAAAPSPMAAAPRAAAPLDRLDRGAGRRRAAAGPSPARSTAAIQTQPHRRHPGLGRTDEAGHGQDRQVKAGRQAGLCAVRAPAVADHRLRCRSARRASPEPRAR